MLAINRHALTLEERAIAARTVSYALAVFLLARRVGIAPGRVRPEYRAFCARRRTASGADLNGLHTRHERLGTADS